MNLLVRNDGAPVTGTFDFACTMRTTAGPLELGASATYQFSKVGKPIAISAPRKFRMR